MNFIYVIHLMCWKYLIALITHSRNRNNSGNGDNKGARALLVAVNAVASVLCAFL